MSKLAHTPLPWGYDGDGFDSVAAQHCGTDGYTVFPVDEDGTCIGSPVCEIDDCGEDEEAEANAAFIVRACNSHYELLEALQNFINGVETNAITSDHDETFANAIGKASAAVAKATGGQL